MITRPFDAEVLYENLSVPMPPEALRGDESRGFLLTSINAGFILERLNQTFGLLGYGWRYDYSPYRIEGNEVIVDVTVQYRISEDPEAKFCPPSYWDTGLNDWWLDRSLPHVWSEPVPSTGGSSLNRKGSTPFLDAHKSAVTSGITKAAGRLGVGIEIYKGENDVFPAPEEKGKRRGASAKSQTPAKSQSARSQPAKAPAPAPTSPNDGEAKALTIASLQRMAQEELQKLERVPVQEIDGHDKTLHSLSSRMQKMGFAGQAVRLISTLFGPGPLTNTKVLAVYNFLGHKNLAADALGLLGAAMFAAERKEEEGK